MFLYVLFFLESFASLFQSLTLSNRLTINLLAGSLLITLLSLISYLFFYSFFVGLVVNVGLVAIFLFELFNSLIQLFIFMLLSIEYNTCNCLMRSLFNSYWIGINVYIKLRSNVILRNDCNYSNIK